MAAEVGMFSVVDQLDPGRADFLEIACEAERWPGWEEAPGPLSEEYFDRLRKEWSAASLVVVNSTWSKRAAMREGCEESKIEVIPLAYEGEVHAVPCSSHRPSRALRVLWLGQVVLRKGIPYLLEAARMLPEAQFTVAGRIGVDRARLAEAPSNVTVLGQVSRDQALHLLREADVFVLPTLSDGFALTQLEAMAHGLPVITTDRCGEVVTDGSNGFLVPVRDISALAAAISALDADRQLLAALSAEALRTSRTFTFHRYLRTLEGAVRKRRPAGALT
ncbi:glycosyltransferase family 4 protein [Frankia tisae]|uniref:glycosyltransferase family 4 protein n=1 Tax=Frankia tisae TaxID=2950104 RepID=UPI0021BE249C|nr:glycosyltransferase family 4 protein [Frankia tisae]